MTGHRPTPQTMKLRVPLEPTTEQSFITEVEKKHYFSLYFPNPWRL